MGSASAIWAAILSSEAPLAARMSAARACARARSRGPMSAHTASRTIGSANSRRSPASLVRGIEAVDRVRIRRIGRELHADADAALDPTLDLAAAHDVLEDARRRLVHRIPRLGDILHANPAGQPDAHDRTNHPRATVTAPAPN
jgi:Dimerisation domain of Zinc Transporter